MKHKFCFLIFLLFLSIQAYADIGVSPIIVDLFGQDADAEIAVKNFDIKNNSYVEIIPYQLSNPANHSGTRTRILHPEKDGLLVFPGKLVLLPGQTQFVRLIKTAKSVKSDQVYEVDFTPKVTTHLITQKNNHGTLFGIRVLIGYGARVTLRPDAPSPSLSFKRINNEIVIKNTGNTMLNITSCSQKMAGKNNEISLPAYTLYVGQTIVKKLLSSNRVTLHVSYMNKPLDPMFTD